MLDAVPISLQFDSPTNASLLVVLTDLTNFAKYTRNHSSDAVFNQMKELNQLIAEFISSQNGILIKFLGDAALAVFPDSATNQVIVALVEFRRTINGWLHKNMTGCQFTVKCHVGDCTIGPTPGFGGQPQLDVLGDPVNICFTMAKGDFVISPQAFRSLGPEARKHFRKYTPPIVYNLSKGVSHE